MEYAIDIITRQKILPTKGAKGICQCCESTLVAKCGRIKMHHWAHKIKCTDSWWQPETEWHREWKSLFPSEWREYKFICKTTNEKHVADIFCPNKELVIEFQNSPITVSEIESRESFYNKMIWVINEKLLTIEINPLEYLISDINEQFELFINERINDTLPISKENLSDLFANRDYLIKYRKKGSFNFEFNKIKFHFDTVIDNLISQGAFSNVLISKPSDIKNNLTIKIKENAIRDINTFIGNNAILPPTNQFYSYKQRNSKSIWNFTNKVVFIDSNSELFWLISDRILKKVPKDEFISKYSNQSLDPKLP